MSEIELGCTILPPGKKGELKPLDNGYYLLPSGGFNFPNRGGITYRVNDYIKKCMNPESDFYRRVTNNQMYMEVGHPKPWYDLKENGKTVRVLIKDVYEWINRLKTIFEDNTCGHIRAVKFDTTEYDRNPTNGAVYTSIEVCPFGEKEAILRSSLTNPSINTAVSIRSVLVAGRSTQFERFIEYWTNFDLVWENGMPNAHKYNAAGLEGFNDSLLKLNSFGNVIIDSYQLIEEIDNLIKEYEAKPEYAGTESHESTKESLLFIRDSLSHQRKQIIDVRHKNVLDIF